MGDPEAGLIVHESIQVLHVALDFQKEFVSTPFIGNLRRNFLYAAILMHETDIGLAVILMHGERMVRKQILGDWERRILVSYLKGERLRIHVFYYLTYGRWDLPPYSKAVNPILKC